MPKPMSDAQARHDRLLEAQRKGGRGPTSAEQKASRAAEKKREAEADKREKKTRARIKSRGGGVGGGSSMVFDKARGILKRGFIKLN